MGKKTGKKMGLSGSTLKIIAMISMLADHFGYSVIGRILVLNGITSTADHSLGYIKELIADKGIGYYYLAYLILRDVIGRIAFPIFCFLLVEGFQRTGSRFRYGSRLFVFALLSEVPFDLMNQRKIWDVSRQNVFFTLLLGLLMMCGMELAGRKIRNLWLSFAAKAAAVAAAAFAAQYFPCDYRAKGILAIALLYFFRQSREVQILAGAVSFAWEPAAMLAFIPVAFYNGERGLKLKYAFYFFYPAHMLALYCMSLFIR